MPRIRILELGLQRRTNGKGVSFRGTRMILSISYELIGFLMSVREVMITNSLSAMEVSLPNSDISILDTHFKKKP